MDYSECMRLQDINFSNELNKNSKKEFQQAGMSINDSKKKIKIPGKDSAFHETKESSKFDDDQFDDRSNNGSQSGCLSILHKSYSKLLPIVKEIYR